MDKQQALLVLASLEHILQDTQQLDIAIKQTIATTYTRGIMEYLIMHDLFTDIPNHTLIDTALLLETACERLRFVNISNPSYALQHYSNLLHKLAVEYIALQEAEYNFRQQQKQAQQQPEQQQQTHQKHQTTQTQEPVPKS